MIYVDVNDYTNRDEFSENLEKCIEDFGIDSTAYAIFRRIKLIENDPFRMYMTEVLVGYTMYESEAVSVSEMHSYKISSLREIQKMFNAQGDRIIIYDDV